jgi:hypothetical protein
MADETTDGFDKMISVIKIKNLSGMEHRTHKEAWIPWLTHVIGCAMDSGVGRKGFIGLVISAQAYTVRYPNEVFQELVDPGPRGDHLSIVQADNHNNQTTAYNRQEKFIKLFRHKIKNALDWISLSALGPEEEAQSMHPRELLRILDELYGVDSLQELDGMKAQLEIPI